MIPSPRDSAGPGRCLAPHTLCGERLRTRTHRRHPGWVDLPPNRTMPMMTVATVGHSTFRVRHARRTWRHENTTPYLQRGESRGRGDCSGLSLVPSRQPLATGAWALVGGLAREQAKLVGSEASLVAPNVPAGPRMAGEQLEEWTRTAAFDDLVLLVRLMGVPPLLADHDIRLASTRPAPHHRSLGGACSYVSWTCHSSNPGQAP